MRQWPASSRRTPPPDIVRTPFQPPNAPVAQPQDQEFLIIGLFAMRLARRLIVGLDNYPHRDADVAWIDNFLANYPLDYALARVTGRRKDDYLATYQRIVTAMKQQPRYPIRFMEMMPDDLKQRSRQRDAGEQGGSILTDIERLNIIDFSDAAREWGSLVPIPAREAHRMIELADQRRIAALSHGQQTGRVRSTSGVGLGGDGYGL